MKRAMILRILLCLPFFLACGTGTGNPDMSAGSHLGLEEPSLADHLVSVCDKISECHSGVSGCGEGLRSQTNFGSRLGVGGAETLAEILQKIESKTYKFHPEADDRCAKGVKALTCDATVVRNAYQSGQANSWAMAAEMLGSECQNVLEKRSVVIPVERNR